MIDDMRHRKVFNCEKFNPTRVDIIGVGAGGSRVAMTIAKLGCTNIRVFDFDSVEAHNVANQIYGNNDIGTKKISALKRRILDETGTEIDTVDVEVDGSQKIGPVVFLLTDTMSSRKEIFERAMRMQFAVELMVEARMAPDITRNYAIDPRDPKQIRLWEETLYTDEEAEESLCGTAQSMGATADINAGLAVSQFVDWFANDRHVQYHEIIYGLRPVPQLIYRSFETGEYGMSSQKTTQAA